MAPFKYPYTPAAAREYQELFDTCVIRESRLKEIDGIVSRMAKSRARYTAVASPFGVPWFVVAIIHNLEASLDFSFHLHNGDPLMARTVQEPPGRPPLPAMPPFTWEESARDAIQFDGLHKVKDWSLPRMLYRFEGFNGYGYHRPSINIPSPYLWSFSTHYSKGKFTADRKYNPDAVSKQAGVAVVLRRLAEQGLASFDDTNTVVDDLPPLDKIAPMVTFDPKRVTEAARQLQLALNGMPGIFLLVDGRAGRATSDALKRVTGHFLVGDPRE